MKRLKKILAPVLVLLLVLSLSGCGMFEMQLLKGVKNMSKLQSVHADASLELNYKVKLGTGSVNMDSAARIGADIESNPLRLRALTEFSFFGLSGRIHSYGELIDENLTIGASLDGEVWESRTTENFSIPEGGFSTAAAAGAAKYLSGFEKQKGSSLIEGREAVRYDGSFSGKEVKEIMVLTGADEALSEQLGSGFSMDMIDDEMELPVSIWLCKKTGMILKLEAELKELADAILSHSLNMLMGIPEDVNIGAGAESAKLVLKLSQFDSLPHIENPLN